VQDAIESELLTTAKVLFLEPSARGRSVRAALDVCSAWHKATVSRCESNDQAWADVAAAVHRSWLHERLIVSLMTVAMLASPLCHPTLRPRLMNLIRAKLEDDGHPTFIALLLNMLQASLSFTSQLHSFPTAQALWVVFEKTIACALKSSASVCHLRAHVKLAAHNLAGHASLNRNALLLADTLGTSSEI
jgi:hypothetical protein